VPLARFACFSLAAFLAVGFAAVAFAFFAICILHSWRPVWLERH
jgi:hypothetical protein